jgi:membrane protease YdiL (CAAX protease family)
MIVDSIYGILIFGLIGTVTNVIGWKQGFYKWEPLPTPRIYFGQLLSVFAIYLGTTFLLMRHFIWLLERYSREDLSIGAIVLLQFFVMLFMMIALYVYGRVQRGTEFRKAWKNPSQTPQSSPLYDFLLGAAAWLLAFPVVQVVGQLFDLFLYIVYPTNSYEQIAVRYLKTTLSSTPLTVLALISIVIVAPIVEEFLFRATLQTYFKRHLGAKKAILMSAVCFAFFHYSPDQGVGNLSLIPSLFTFACFLGYIYERQGSLYASIGLHLTFNFISSFRILFSLG